MFLNLKKYLFLTLLAFLGLGSTMTSYGMRASTRVAKKVLENGLTVLVSKVPITQKVALQMWYRVGSKDEKTGEYGIAHFLEHTLFKGTDTMSESDVFALAQKLGGDCNAFTAHDHTCYVFNVPDYNWKKVLPVFADCMCNCTFKQDLLNSEVKAVVQELKMYKDKHDIILQEKMMSAIWPDHPYHNPIIGYKQDLWNLNRDAIVSFYKKHYIPNNAVFVVVGNVDPEEVFAQAEEVFGSIPANFDYKKEEHYSNKDICRQNIVIYRDIQKPIVRLNFCVPGMNEKDEYVGDMLQQLLCGGKNARLYKKLVEELQLVTEIKAESMGLDEQDLFSIFFKPKKAKDINAIINIIKNELKDIAHNGFAEEELQREAIKVKKALYDLAEHNFQKAQLIGRFYLIKGDENYFFSHYQYDDLALLNEDIMDFCATYLRPSLMHKGVVLPLEQEDKDYWIELQERSDAEDARILNGKVRESEVEEPVYTPTVDIGEPSITNLAKPTVTYLNNGIKVLSYSYNTTRLITLKLQLKADGDYDSATLPGLYNLLCAMLYEGTQNYTGNQLAEALESRAIDLIITPGSITMKMLDSELEKGLEILQEILTKSTLPEKMLGKIKEMAIGACKDFNDNEQLQAHQLILEHLYEGHPNSKNAMGTEESINAITRKDLVDFYKRYISPNGAVLSIAGNLEQYDINDLLEKTLDQWSGPAVEDIEYPAIKDVQPQELTKEMNRDQIVLCFAGLSVDRMHPDFDALSIFNQIFGHGHSRLFALREKTGAFYKIYGNVIYSSNTQPGMIYIVAIVSPDRLTEVENLLKETIDTVVDTITPQEVEEAKNKIIIYPADLYSTSSSMTNTFLFLDQHNLPFDYFEKRKDQLKNITVDQVKEAVKKILSTDKMITVKVGRV